MTRLLFKRHYKLLVLLALVVGLLVTGAGDQRIVAYTAGPAISYGDVLAILVHNVAGGIQIPRSAPGVSADITR